MRFGDTQRSVTQGLGSRAAVTRGALRGQREYEGRQEQRHVVARAQRDQRAEGGVGYGEIGGEIWLR